MRAYSAGAYRAATILLWTAVMQDLTEKLRILSDGGDGAAKAAIKEVDAARTTKDVRGMQAFENGLLSRATTEFELVTHREAEELHRLSEDRNISAHPSFQEDSEEPFQITAEQVRAYARLVVEAVLAQPPIVGKALVDRFTTDIQTGSWPSEALVDFLRTRYFERARSGVMRNIVAVAVKAAIRPPDGSNQVAGRCVAVIQASAQIDEPLVVSAITEVLSKWRDHLSDPDLLRTLGAVGSFKATSASLGSDNVARTRALLASADPETLVHERAFASGPPVESALMEIYTEAINRLSVDQLEAMTKKPYPRAQWVPRVLREAGSVQSWRAGERAMRMALHVSGSFTLSDIESIASHFLENHQINEAADMPQLIELMVRATAKIPGANEVWRRALDAYAATYKPDKDPGGYYNYSEARAALDV